MLYMRWKAPGRLIRIIWVPVQGDAVFLDFLRRENPTKPYLGSKLVGLIENPFVSVTIDVLMMRIPSFRAIGSNRGEWQRWEGR